MQRLCCVVSACQLLQQKMQHTTGHMSATVLSKLYVQKIYTCDLPLCLKPSGRRVRCDGCDRWNHVTCVGLLEAPLSEDSYEYFLVCMLIVAILNMNSFSNMCLITHGCCSAICIGENANNKRLVEWYGNCLTSHTRLK